MFGMAVLKKTVKASLKELVCLTQEGLEKVKQELDQLINIDRPAVLQKIMYARDQGDITDNSEYESAREDQAFIEGRIMELENIIKRVRVVEADSDHGKVTVVELGTTVTVVIDDKDEQIFTIVGSAEVDPLEGKISHESPVGKALLGLKAGDIVEVTTPQAKLVYKIKKIS